MTRKRIILDVDLDNLYSQCISKEEMEFVEEFIKKEIVLAIKDKCPKYTKIVDCHFFDQEKADRVVILKEVKRNYDMGLITWAEYLTELDKIGLK